MVVLGFEGLDPDLAARWIGEGLLPNLATLAQQGGLHRLATTPAAEPASAWATFATGLNPGRHDIFDSTARDAHTYAATRSLTRREPGRYLFDAIPWSPERIVSRRKGTPFWVAVDRAGIRASVLNVPGTFPPDDLQHGELLSGWPVPDLQGTPGTYTYYGTDVAREDEGPTPFGGMVRRLVFSRRVAQAELVGPRNPIVEQQARRIRAAAELSDGDRAELADLSADALMRIPFSVTWNHEARTANIELQGELVHLVERQWSRWIEVEFQVNPLVRIRGMLQFLLMDAGQHLRLYATPLHPHPAHPLSPISSPPSFAADLFERLGPYRTIGWPQATAALADGRIDEAAFLDDLERAFDDSAETILSRIDAPQWDLVVGDIDALDRVQHLFWRLIDPGHPMYDAEAARTYGDAIRRFYMRADALVGQILSRVPPGTAVMILSDHGFQPFRSAFHVNSWLVQHGFMALRDRDEGSRATDEGTSAAAERGPVDWTRTQAYAVGLGQIFVNLAGREAQGTVKPGAEYEALVDRLAGALRRYRDPRSGAPVVRHVYTRGEIYGGPFVDDAPDLQVGVAPGYRVSWQTALGMAPAAIIEPNLSRWSGDHASVDYTTCAGILLSTERAASDTASLADIAPTVLKFFGVAAPEDLDGTPLF